MVPQGGWPVSCPKGCFSYGILHPAKAGFGVFRGDGCACGEGGQLKRFQHVGGEKEGYDADECDAVIVFPWFFMEIAGNHHLAEIVVDLK